MKNTKHHLIAFETKLTKNDPKRSTLLRKCNAQTLRVNPPSLRDSINLDAFFAGAPKSSGLDDNGNRAMMPPTEDGPVTAGAEGAAAGGARSNDEGFEAAGGNGEGSELSSTTFNYMVKDDGSESRRRARPRVDLEPAKGMAKKNVDKISMVLQLCEKVDCKGSLAFTGIRRASVMLDPSRSPLHASASGETVRSGVIFGMKGSHDWIDPAPSRAMPSPPDRPSTPSSAPRYALRMRVRHNPRTQSPLAPRH